MIFLKIKLIVIPEQTLSITIVQQDQGFPAVEFEINKRKGKGRCTYNAKLNQITTHQFNYILVSNVLL